MMDSGGRLFIAVTNDFASLSMSTFLLIGCGAVA